MTTNKENKLNMKQQFCMNHAECSEKNKNVFVLPCRVVTKHTKNIKLLPLFLPLLHPLQQAACNFIRPPAPP